MFVQEHPEIEMFPDDFWQLEELLIVLEPFVSAVTMLEGEKYSTINLLMPVWRTLERQAQSVLDEKKNLTAAGKLARRVIGQLHYREEKENWGFSDASKIGAVLDPRFRTMKWLDGDDERNELMTSLRQLVDNERRELENATGSGNPDPGLDAALAGAGAGSGRGLAAALQSGKDEKKASEPKEHPLASKRAAPGSSVEETTAKKRRLWATVLQEFGDVKSAADPNDEIDEYFKLPFTIAPDTQFDVLLWWKQHAYLFPLLCRVARRYLGIPATEAAIERVWSTGGNLVTPKRTRLRDENAAQTIMLHENVELVHAAIANKLPQWNRTPVFVLPPGRASLAAARAARSQAGADMDAQISDAAVPAGSALPAAPELAAAPASAPAPAPVPALAMPARSLSVGSQAAVVRRLVDASFELR